MTMEYAASESCAERDRLVGEEGASRELLSDRASAFGDVAYAEVADEGASSRWEIVLSCVCN
jgi:hypothetical protein